MRKKKACNVIIHIEDNLDYTKLANKVSELYVQVVKRKLNESDLTTENKIAVIDKIIEDFKIT